LELADDSHASVDDIDDIADCCNFDRDCEDTLDEVQECLVHCFNSCLTFTAEAWYDCVQDETGSHGCSRAECLDEFLDEVEDKMKLSGSGDLFDFEQVQKKIEKIAMDDLEDCSLLEDFVDTACKAGDDCCDECQSELAATLDCLINDIVTPFVAGQLNKTLPECPITDECKTDFDAAKAAARSERGGSKEGSGKRDLLSKVEADLFHKKALSLPAKQKNPGNPKRRPRRVQQADEGTDRDAVLAQCQRKMETDILLHNMTHAANNYMTCINAAVFAVLEDPEDSAMGMNNLVSLVTFGMGAGVSMLLLM
jgi:hypothetical protein